MATKRQSIRHIFGGGYSSDLGPTVEVPVDQFGRVVIPHLTKAENVIFELDGGPHKVGGTSKINSSALESGAAIRGIFDYWKIGTAGTPTQKRVVHVNTVIMADDADGSFANIFTGLSATAIPNYNLFDDLLIISSDSTTDVPKSWDQTTAQNLAGTPPNFAFSVTHKNRVWAAGDAANPSLLYFSEVFDPEIWTPSGTAGSLSIDPNDGDKITGIISHKNDLWVFKGPFKGSIHRITGSAPTGSDTFARIPFIKGVGAVSHNTIFRFRDDIGFMWSDGSIRSLQATNAFGDFNEASLSRDIQTEIVTKTNFARLDQAWAVMDVTTGIVVISLTGEASTTNNKILMLDFRFEPVRWAVWTEFDASALAIMIDQDGSDFPTLTMGSTDGFVKKMLQTRRSIDGVTAISSVVTTPFIHYGSPSTFKTLAGLSVGVRPKGAFDFLFNWRRDSEPTQSKSITQSGGGAVLAPAAANQFTLGTSTLGGGDFTDIYVDMDEGGEFRAVQYEMSDSVNNQDLEIHTFSTSIELDAESEEN